MTLSGSALQDVARQTAEALAEVTSGYPFTRSLLVYKVSGRVFLIITEDPNEEIITVKAEPPHIDALVTRHESIQPGRYLDKYHWVSIGPGTGVTESLVQDLVRESYDLVVDGLPRRDRERIRGHSDV